MTADKTIVKFLFFGSKLATSQGKRDSKRYSAETDCTRSSAFRNKTRNSWYLTTAGTGGAPLTVGTPRETQKCRNRKNVSEQALCYNYDVPATNRRGQPFAAAVLNKILAYTCWRKRRNRQKRDPNTDVQPRRNMHRKPSIILGGSVLEGEGGGSKEKEPDQRKTRRVYPRRSG